MNSTARIGGGAFWHFWLYRGYLTEGRTILERILTQFSEQTPARAWVLLNAGLSARFQGDSTRATILLEGPALRKEPRSRKVDKCSTVCS